MTGKKAKLQRKQQQGGQLEESGPSFMSGLARNNGPYKEMAGILIKGTETHITQRVGLLPPPEMLSEYEKILPGATERFLSFVEKEQANRHEIEKQLTEAITKDAETSRNADKRGDFIAVYIYSTCMITGGAVLYFGYPVPLAAALMGTPLITSIATFLFRRRQTKLTKNGQLNPQ